MQFLKNIFIFFVSPVIVLTFFSFSNIKKETFDLEKSELSIVTSLVDSSTVQKIVKKHYFVDEPIKASLISVGINDMYLVETQEQKYILRLSRADKYITLTNTEFQFELEWLEYLFQHQVPVSYPIRRLDNELYGLIQAPEGPRYVTLFSYAKGTTDINTEQAYILGKALAQLHIISDNFTTPLNRAHLDIDHLVIHNSQQIKSFLKNIDEQKCVLLDEVVKELMSQFSVLEIDKLNYGIIAGDIHGYNQYFTNDNNLTMFDFEFCAFGYRIFDIATFKWRRGSENQELWNSFLEGYQSIRKLNDAENIAIDLFVKARHLWWMALKVSLSESKHKLDAKFWENAFSLIDNSN